MRPPTPAPRRKVGHAQPRHHDTTALGARARRARNVPAPGPPAMTMRSDLALHQPGAERAKQISPRLHIRKYIIPRGGTAGQRYTAISVPSECGCGSLAGCGAVPALRRGRGVSGGHAVARVSPQCHDGVATVSRRCQRVSQGATTVSFGVRGCGDTLERRRPLVPPGVPGKANPATILPGRV